MIASVRQSPFGRIELWAVQLDGPRTGWGEPAYRALFAVASGEIPGRVSRCELGHTPLHAKRPITRERAVELHPELVRRAEAALVTVADADAGDTVGAGQARRDGLNWHDPARTSATVADLLIADEATEDERGDA